MTHLMHYIQNKWNSIDERKKPIVQFILFAVLLLVMETILYSHFIFGSRALVFVEQGSDSWAQSMPFFLNAAERFSEFDFSTWNFSQFLGTTTVQAVNPEYIVSVFGKAYVGPMMLVSQMAKIFLAGVFFYLFAYYWNASYATRVISSLGIAFCGRMTALEAWTGYTMEITLAIALLWAFERFLSNKKKFIALPIAFALMIAALGLYGAVLYSFVMLIYVAFRLVYGNHRLVSRRDYFVFCLQLLILYIAGILLIAISFFPAIEGYRDSARVGADSSSVTLPQQFSIEVFAAELLSLFSPTLLGSMADYSGPCNTLNNPYFYCGALLILTAPYSFASKSPRQIIALGCFAGMSLLYVISPSFRYILNGFGVGPYDFRMSSFWITIVIAVLGMQGLDYIRNTKSTKKALLWPIISFALLAFACFILRQHIWKTYLAITIIFLLFYSIALFIRKPSSIGAIMAAAVIACCAEALIQSWPLVNDAPVVTKDVVANYYNDDFANDLDEIDGNDDLLYRIDWKTTLLARSMAFGYRGTQAYIGGTGIMQSHSEFLKHAYQNDYLETLGYSRYAYGFADNALNTLLGVRYLVYEYNQSHPDIQYYAPYGYDLIANGPRYVIYENKYALPFILSYGYDEAITSGQYLETNRNDRGLTMLEYCVVPDELKHEGHPTLTTSTTSRQDNRETLGISNDKLETAGENDAVTITIAESDSPYLLIEMEMDGRTAESNNITILATLESPSAKPLSIPYLTAIGHESISIPVKNEGYTSATFQIEQVNAFNSVTISSFKVESISKEYFDAYLLACDDKLSEKPEVAVATNSEVSGNLSVANDGYIVTSVPWSESWHAYIDGTEVPTFPVNYGFVGMETKAGPHNISLVYRDLSREIGQWVSLATIALLAIARIIPLIHRRRRLAS